MSAPPVLSAMPPPGYAAPQWPNQPMPQPPAANPGRQQPPWPGGAQVQQPPPRPPVVRAKGDDDEPSPPRQPPAVADARPAPLSLPSPEQLGVARARADQPPPIDWNDIQRRLDRLGVVSLQEQKLLDGSDRVTCLLPVRPGGASHRVEAEGDSLAQAVGLALGRVEKWVKEN
jgi:hypothetical protein